jgi:glycosyltransferase involved in cell wall biosynthesis
MYIWFINHYAVPPALYPLARTTNYAKYLIQAGHSVTIFAASMVHNSDINLIADKTEYVEETVDGIPYVYIRTSSYTKNNGARVINMFQFACRLSGVCKHFLKPDVIIASSATPLACMAGIRLARKYHCKCIAEISDLWPESFVAYGIINKRNPILKPMYWYEKHMYKKADKLIFTMEGGRDYIVEKGWDKASGGPIDLDKVYHINNGVDLDVFEYNKEHYRIEEPDLENEDIFKVIYTGSIRMVNKVGLLLDAAKILKEKGIEDIKFLIWGDGDEKIHLEKRVKEENLHNVCFKGRVDKKYIPYITSQSHLNIAVGENQPLFNYGGSMNKMFDYFAAGHPVLFTFKMGYSIIDKYGAGIEQSDSSPAKIAEAILYFKNLSKDEYDKYCVNAKRAADDYDFARLTEQLIQIIEK